MLSFVVCKARMFFFCEKNFMLFNCESCEVYIFLGGFVGVMGGVNIDFLRLLFNLLFGIVLSNNCCICVIARKFLGFIIW